MNQRGNYKHQTHTKKTHIPTDYKHQTHSKDTHIPTYYKHQIDIPTYRRRCWLLEGEIGVGDQRCLYSERKREPVSGYWGESDEKKRGMYTWVWCSGSGSSMGPTKSRKFWVMRSWKYVPNVWGLENLGILSDEWGVMSSEWWVKKIKWEVRSDSFLKTKQPLNNSKLLRFNSLGTSWGFC